MWWDRLNNYETEIDQQRANNAATQFEQQVPIQPRSE